MHESKFVDVNYSIHLSGPHKMRPKFLDGTPFPQNSTCMLRHNIYISV